MYLLHNNAVTVNSLWPAASEIPRAAGGQCGAQQQSQPSMVSCRDHKRRHVVLDPGHPAVVVEERRVASTSHDLWEYGTVHRCLAAVRIALYVNQRFCQVCPSPLNLPLSRHRRVCPCRAPLLAYDVTFPRVETRRG